MSAFLFKISKRSSVPLRMVLVLFVTIFGVFVFTVCIKQITIENKSNNIALTTEKERSHCNLHASAQEELPQIHFPQPKTYSRGECSCNPVRFFVLFSMQRSGSGWFETLLNSHPNISSHGEIFSVKERRINISSIIKTLDSVYNLDWFSSASKNECVAAVGFKWMLNQVNLL
ncbi:P-loop containing nucleoside triphosphate hydrolase protein [Dioscorea alata]|uniref:P-loop containing nucleoside triphosphate hydrolase protein n=2 Tax=Dioscorea alata TaxID=55571 RepID=A0ACB7V1X8_DIOAL|nr:P-loop containing nucleoside triphosphate hydrolase protein [Dioscorea alata]KAH7667259.1 P-loop containing nucleoside triphosphate hydrolase protein [Dioscorea alata]